jgi:peroxiredoxin
MSMKRMRAAVSACLLLAGCEISAPDPYGYRSVDASITFRDDVETNVPLEGELTTLEFTTRDGNTVSLKELAGGKTVILVVTRGYAGSICPYCSTQVSRLIAKYPEFAQRQAEVVVVYPLSKPEETNKADEFVNRAVSMLSQPKVPFPIVLDLELKAVDALAIRKDLSKPATYILDPQGRLQFAYVGNTLADRPSVQALIDQLERINKLAQRS